ncbi:integral membrane protein S linking to the trans Golgi network-domain-containing protein [Tribonema minus]|uniref:Integral membrane protein S linking to the trans Golgi network-domain-containing protein n=1 Tax=Tribonema minus TaxID=303371 RepID=A0A835ZG38_9STRA|nr:integral membrane protein S linking to the trans Golgi network-domain-containing protein [Tribonema minus]
MAVFDAKLTVMQIVALQSFYYVVMGVVLTCFRIIFGTKLSLSLMFSAANLSFASAPGLTGVFATLVTAALGALLLVVIVEKTKRCLDFTATLFLVHAALTCAFGGAPRRWEWYVVQGCALVIMVLLGEFLCARNEMRDIPLYTPLSVTPASASAGAVAAASRDIEMGPRSSGGGGGRGGGGGCGLSPIHERRSPLRDLVAPQQQQRSATLQARLALSEPDP